MLPVQTVMIRYMVLVYRWGSGRLGTVGDWEGFMGGAVTGGCARGRVPMEAHMARVRKGPANVGPAGLSLPEPGTKRPRRRGSAGLYI